ncbi:MAG TPA: hypothetical protein VJ752_09535 [Burkholderiaceae bacterium]|nr:hypothetical protein [Burkholderiaceae bacterium]
MQDHLLKRRLTAIALALAGVAATSSVLASHAWSDYHWARATPQFTLKLGDNLTTANWHGHLAQASQDWNSGNSAVLTAIVAGAGKKRCGMLSGTTQVCNGTYGNNGWLGLASININSDHHITQGSAKMNDTYFNTAYYNNPNEREHVMCQEVAHTFGLDHQSTDGSSLNTCMDYFSNTGANAGSALSTKPNAHDFDELNIIYAHLDSYSTVSALAAIAAAASADVDVTDDPASWGTLLRQSADGRSSTYARYNTDGSTTITHVYWTIEAAGNCPACDHRRDYLHR